MTVKELIELGTKALERGVKPDDEVTFIREYNTSVKNLPMIIVDHGYCRIVIQENRDQFDAERADNLIPLSAGFYGMLVKNEELERFHSYTDLLIYPTRYFVGSNIKIDDIKVNDGMSYTEYYIDRDGRLLIIMENMYKDEYWIGITLSYKEE